jgi:hypothetical protein
MIIIRVKVRILLIAIPRRLLLLQLVLIPILFVVQELAVRC